MSSPHPSHTGAPNTTHRGSSRLALSLLPRNLRSSSSQAGSGLVTGAGDNAPSVASTTKPPEPSPSSAWGSSKVPPLSHRRTPHGSPGVSDPRSADLTNSKEVSYAASWLRDFGFSSFANSSDVESSATRDNLKSASVASPRQAGDAPPRPPSPRPLPRSPPSLAAPPSHSPATASVASHTTSTSASASVVPSISAVAAAPSPSPASPATHPLSPATRWLDRDPRPDDDDEDAEDEDEDGPRLVPAPPLLPAASLQLPAAMTVTSLPHLLHCIAVPAHLFHQHHAVLLGMLRGPHPGRCPGFVSFTRLAGGGVSVLCDLPASAAICAHLNAAVDRGDHGDAPAARALVSPVAWAALRLSEGDMTAFTVESGLVSAVSSELARHGFPILYYSTHSADHVLVHADALPAALRVLGDRFHCALALRLPSRLVHFATDPPAPAAAPLAEPPLVHVRLPPGAAPPAAAPALDLSLAHLPRDRALALLLDVTHQHRLAHGYARIRVFDGSPLAFHADAPAHTSAPPSPRDSPRDTLTAATASAAALQLLPRSLFLLPLTHAELPALLPALAACVALDHPRAPARPDYRLRDAARAPHTLVRPRARTWAASSVDGLVSVLCDREWLLRLAFAAHAPILPRAALHRRARSINRLIASPEAQARSAPAAAALQRALTLISPALPAACLDPPAPGPAPPHPSSLAHALRRLLAPDATPPLPPAALPPALAVLVASAPAALSALTEALAAAPPVPPPVVARCRALLAHAPSTAPAAAADSAPSTPALGPDSPALSSTAAEQAPDPASAQELLETLVLVDAEDMVVDEWLANAGQSVTDAVRRPAPPPPMQWLGRSWRAIMLEGTWPLDSVGIVQALSTPITDINLCPIYLSTYYTDLLLVPQPCAVDALAVLAEKFSNYSVFMSIHNCELSEEKSGVYALYKRLRRNELGILNRLKSITVDVERLRIFLEGTSNLPVLSNLRCGKWYVPPHPQSPDCYFKSTDGHPGEWHLSWSRVNTHVVCRAATAHSCVIVQDEVAKFHQSQHHPATPEIPADYSTFPPLHIPLRGALIADATRKGKRFPDSQSRTIPIWAAAANSVFFKSDHREATSPGRQPRASLFLPPWVSRSEAALVAEKLPQLTADLASHTAAQADAVRATASKPACGCAAASDTASDCAADAGRWAPVRQLHSALQAPGPLSSVWVQAQDAQGSVCALNDNLYSYLELAWSRRAREAGSLSELDVRARACLRGIVDRHALGLYFTVRREDVAALLDEEAPESEAVVEVPDEAPAACAEALYLRVVGLLAPLAGLKASSLVLYSASAPETSAGTNGSKFDDVAVLARAVKVRADLLAADAGGGADGLRREGVDDVYKCPFAARAGAASAASHNQLLQAVLARMRRHGSLGSFAAPAQETYTAAERQCRDSWTYVQGAGDDEEAWAHGLSPEVFWAHCLPLLLTENNDECADMAASAMNAATASAGTDVDSTQASRCAAEPVWVSNNIRVYLRDQLPAAALHACQHRGGTGPRVLLCSGSVAAGWAVVGDRTAPLPPEAQRVWEACAEAAGGAGPLLVSTVPVSSAKRDKLCLLRHGVLLLAAAGLCADDPAAAPVYVLADDLQTCAVLAAALGAVQQQPSPAAERLGAHIAAHDPQLASLARPLAAGGDWVAYQPPAGGAYPELGFSKDQMRLHVNEVIARDGFGSVFPARHLMQQLNGLMCLAKR